MEGGDSSLGPYAPCTEAAPCQKLGESAGSLGLGNQCGSIQEVDDAQLVGVPLAVVGEATTLVKVAEARAAGVMEIKSGSVGLVGPTGQVIEKRKRGRPPKGQAPKPPPPKRIKEEEEEEDVCFICFDGGSLVLCDRKGCPKAYHPACIKRDESFFRSKAKWNCGWHICSVCQKAAQYMCYTCTYSLCKGCTKDAEYVCVRGNKGFCMTCMRTIMLIENKDTGNKELIQVDFDDKTSWEYLFKVYWVYLKSKLSLTLNELTDAKNPWRVGFKQQSPDKSNFAKAGVVHVPVESSSQMELKMSKQQPELLKLNSLSSEKLSSDKSETSNGRTEWASRDLLEFVGHMRNGDTSVLSEFDVQRLLIDYIKINNLRDPHRKSQIVCDLRLKNLFGKPRVGHIEMLKLLEYHFLTNEDTQKSSFIPAGFVGSAPNHGGVEQNNAVVPKQCKKRKTRKKGEERAPQTNLEEFAAIDVHNMNLIYLRRNLMESLLGEPEKFQDKVIGSIVRIRVSCSDQKQDIYRLVQVVGTSKAAEPYKIGDNTADMMLEILNLDKKEIISIDAISNQEFSEDECRRLRQSIKCGLVKRLTVGEIQMKAIALQAVRLNDWLEAEILRLNHLRDRANEKGHQKELRECIEKLQLLKTPEERQRRLAEIPEVHADPKMNPDYGSEDDAAGYSDKKKDEFLSPRNSKFGMNGNQQVHLRRKVKEDRPIRTQHFNEKSDTAVLNSSAKHENQVVVCGLANHWSNQAVVGSASKTSTETSTIGSSPPIEISEMEKLWHYRDPNGKVQGPFSMLQLRKWIPSGYFPDDMRIWTSNEQNDSLLLTDALNGQFHRTSPLQHNLSLQSQEIGVASNDRFYVADGCHKFNSERGSDRKQEVLQFMDSRIESNSNHEFVRAEGSGSLTSDWSKQTVDKEQTGSMQQSALSRNSNSCSGHSQLHSKHHSLDLEQTNVAHEAMEINFVLDRGNESSNEMPMHQISGQQCHENPSSSQISVGQSSGQNCRSLSLNLDLNENDSNSCSVSLTRPPNDSSEQNGRTELRDLPSPTSKICARNVEGLAAEEKKPMPIDVPAPSLGLSDFPSPTPKPLDEDLPSSTPKSTTEGLPSTTSKPTDEDLGQQIDETKQSVPSKISIEDSCPNWSKGSTLPVDGPQLEGVADEWGGCSPTRAKPSVEEWDPCLLSMSSLKPPEAVGDQVAPPNANNRLAHSSPSHPATDVSGWRAVVNEPIEFSTLAEESVSDLLAEVDAMESQSGLASPTSAMKYSDERNDCFSSIEELSPTPDAGKSDALSSPTDMHFPSQETVINDPVGVSHADAFDRLKKSGGHSTSSSEGETKCADVPINNREVSSDIHPVPCTVSQSMSVAAMARGRGLEMMDTGWATVQGNMNLGWGGPSQGFANIGWGPNLGTPWGNPNFNLGAYNGSAPWDNQRRYGGERFAGSRDWAFPAGDMGFGRGRPTWNRQSHGGGGGYSRQPPKGQRVCKFYESGHCKKGASCDYLHP